MTRVKICGITRLEDALCAVEAGADALGFVFYDPSPRAIAVDQAASIIAQLPAFVTTTALFVDPAPELVDRVVQDVQVDLLQFHGKESPEFCQGFARPWIKALRMKPDLDVLQQAQRFHAGRGILLDAYRPGVPGGTGEAFDWDRIPVKLASRIILAGGLNPENVAQAVCRVRPFAVDVSGGVEEGPGIKSCRKIKAFIDQVRAADRS
ncbi:N-(5'-phosphoribosyl)anthranilate isomerase [Marinobacterium zhoushanense]|uniref:N-(5'-phosphoribosyl)anthranilate isomerase n=1 Tax=Marinobacterium zhoushanense TaxID=1679163 RepID=A0ABQ1K7W4_9GAMM|nr:phosphoribosylanthranilate isomerase [Marinobacterium zhoushanense]GGB90452.1 N-(5'-phosphoribosyl)anthranilate isomerase [Marinobacterium zhoushanense]